MTTVQHSSTYRSHHTYNTALSIVHNSIKRTARLPRELLYSINHRFSHQDPHHLPTMKPLIAIPVTLLLALRSHRRQSLTPLGILAAVLTATLHALPESPLPFTLLITFFLLGTSATRVKHAEKALLTLSSSGSSGGEGPRTHVQVLANSICASALCLVEFVTRSDGPLAGRPCFDKGGGASWLDWCIMGCVANYAAVAADTLSSELGILAKGLPVLVTAPWRRVPKGTNGGVTGEGVFYGGAGAVAIGATSVMLVPFCEEWSAADKAMFVAAVGVWGTMGSLLDSLLGAWFQASVIDRRTGKVVEGSGGVKVKTKRRESVGEVVALRQRKAVEKGGEKDMLKGNAHESRFIGSGRDILDNNGINFLMATIMTAGGILMGEKLRRSS